jgi:hypothetical protein
VKPTAEHRLTQRLTQAFSAFLRRRRRLRHFARPPLLEILGGRGSAQPAAATMSHDLLRLAQDEPAAAIARLQSALIGESLPVEKFVQRIGDSLAPLAQSKLVFMGTNVVSGAAAALVCATGSASYFGHLAASVSATDPLPNAFQAGVNSVSWLRIRFACAMVPVVFLVNGLGKGDWAKALLFALSVAVGVSGSGEHHGQRQHLPPGRADRRSAGPAHQALRPSGREHRLQRLQGVVQGGRDEDRRRPYSSSQVGIILVGNWRPYQRVRVGRSVTTGVLGPAFARVGAPRADRDHPVTRLQIDRASERWLSARRAARQLPARGPSLRHGAQTGGRRRS